MAAAAPGSEPLRSSPSARPLDHARSRRREESGPSRGSRRRAATAAPQKRPAIIYEASPRGALNQASFPISWNDVSRKYATAPAVPLRTWGSVITLEEMEKDV
ncbi:hypothetical protein NDU88_002716 [Pleurodeles waltl]|uniref:Uncharacterized protein n=1 Tax=Pleurodeles waltl TaxID=8319 RepID=A0AAV7M368_PLEWA|nr:hypothetical protein NDU88_002716 [Pleurodeles waltl]